MTYDISFVIPAFNEEGYIENAIESIERYVADVSYEIIVVDNGSNDGTGEEALARGAKVYSIDKATVAFARNYGAERACSQVIAFIDADIRLTKQWAAELSKQLECLKVQRMFTGARCSIPENPSWIEKNWFAPLAAKEVSYINSANLIVNKAAFLDVGSFHSILATGEDYELSMRAKEKGVSVLLNPGFEAIHDGFPKNLKNFFFREMWHGRGDFQSWRSFFTSHVAVAAVIIGVVQIFSIVFLLLGLSSVAVLLLMFLFSLALMASIKLFSRSGMRFVFYNIPLCYVYFTARFFSLVNELKISR